MDGKTQKTPLAIGINHAFTVSAIMQLYVFIALGAVGLAFLIQLGWVLGGIYLLILLLMVLYFFVLRWVVRFSAKRLGLKYSTIDIQRANKVASVSFVILHPLISLAALPILVFLMSLIPLLEGLVYASLPLLSLMGLIIGYIGAVIAFSIFTRQSLGTYVMVGSSQEASTTLTPLSSSHGVQIRNGILIAFIAIVAFGVTASFLTPISSYAGVGTLLLMLVTPIIMVFVLPKRLRALSLSYLVSTLIIFGVFIFIGLTFWSDK